MDEDTLTKDPADVRLTINVHEATLEDKYNTSKELLPAVLQVSYIYVCVICIYDSMYTILNLIITYLYTYI